MCNLIFIHKIELVQTLLKAKWQIDPTWISSLITCAFEGCQRGAVTASTKVGAPSSPSVKWKNELHSPQFV